MAPSVLPEYPEATRRAFARTALERSLQVKRGESLLIDTWSATLPWAETLALEARILGVRPMLVVEDEPTYWKAVDEAPAANVGAVGAHEWAALQASDAVVYFYGPMDTARDERMTPSLAGRISANDHEWFRLIAKYGVRVARFDLGRTSEIWARRYGVELDQWRKELIAGATLDPRTLQRDGARIAERFYRGHEAHLTHPNGTDLTLRFKGRKPVVDDGVLDAADVRAGNLVTVLPSGVALVTVDETYAEGTIVGNIAGVMFAQGRETALRPGHWTFERGRLTDFGVLRGAEGGGEAFRREFARLGPGKVRPGLISVGLNPAISSIPLLFDQARGVVSVTIGRNSQHGGATRTPHFTAYQSLKGATLEVDGAVVVDTGSLPAASG